MEDQKKLPGLLARDIRELNQKQLDQFVFENITAANVGNFEPHSALQLLKSQSNQRAIGIDVGGDKMLIQLFSVNENGGLNSESSYSEIQKDRDGIGYVSAMEEASRFVSENNFPVGLSIGFSIEGTKPRRDDSGKLPAMRKDLKEKYDYDFANLFRGKLACLNDGPAGLISGAIQANINFGNVRNVIYLINGGGIGAAVLKDGQLIATEAGHVDLVPELNLYDETRICDRLGRAHVCFEHAASNKEGIEIIWQRKTGEKLTALEIEKRFTDGQEDGNLAIEVYDYSALMLTHLIKGLATTFEINLNDPATAVVGHGGAFKFPDYGARIKQILAKNGENIQLIMTKDYSDNACAEGAAIAALTL